MAHHDEPPIEYDRETGMISTRRHPGFRFLYEEDCTSFIFQRSVIHSKKAKHAIDSFLDEFLPHCTWARPGDIPSSAADKGWTMTFYPKVLESPKLTSIIVLHYIDTRGDFAEKVWMYVIPASESSDGLWWINFWMLDFWLREKGVIDKDLVNNYSVHSRDWRNYRDILLDLHHRDRLLVFPGPFKGTIPWSSEKRYLNIPSPGTRSFGIAGEIEDADKRWDRILERNPPKSYEQEECLALEEKKKFSEREDRRRMPPPPPRAHLADLPRSFSEFAENNYSRFGGRVESAILHSWVKNGDGPEYVEVSEAFYASFWEEQLFSSRDDFRPMERSKEEKEARDRSAKAMVARFMRSQRSDSVAGTPRAIQDEPVVGTPTASNLVEPSPGLGVPARRPKRPRSPDESPTMATATIAASGPAQYRERVQSEDVEMSDTDIPPMPQTPRLTHRRLPTSNTANALFTAEEMDEFHALTRVPSRQDSMQSVGDHNAMADLDEENNAQVETIDRAKQTERFEHLTPTLHEENPWRTLSEQFPGMTGRYPPVMERKLVHHHPESELNKYHGDVPPTPRSVMRLPFGLLMAHGGEFPNAPRVPLIQWKAPERPVLRVFDAAGGLVREDADKSPRHRLNQDHMLHPLDDIDCDEMEED